MKKKLTREQFKNLIIERMNEEADGKHSETIFNKKQTNCKGLKYHGVVIDFSEVIGDVGLNYYNNTIGYEEEFAIEDLGDYKGLNDLEDIKGNYLGFLLRSKKFQNELIERLGEVYEEEYEYITTD